jgi:hypothetical protein
VYPGFVVHALTTFLSSKLENAVFRLEGEPSTLNSIATIYGNKVTVEHIDEVPDNPITTLLQRVVESGVGSSG